MSNKIFRRLLMIVTASGIISTAVLVVYTAVLYKNASVIEFIAGGR